MAGTERQIVVDVRDPKMIVDADCHIWSLREGGNIAADERLLRMDRAGVDKVMGWNILERFGLE